MLHKIPGLLNKQQLKQVMELFDSGVFTDGSHSVGSTGNQVKNNEEMANAPQFTKLNDIILNSLRMNTIFQTAARPHKIGSPMYARYHKGMEFGQHVDNPIAQGWRLDIAITIFLSDPSTYDGGELVIETDVGEYKIKLPAGHAVLYPASSRHRVAKITRGERKVAVTGVQSMVRDPIKRDLLFELSKAYSTLNIESPGSEMEKQISYVYVNLVRRWCDM